MNLRPVSSNHQLIVRLPTALTSPAGRTTAEAAAGPAPRRDTRPLSWCMLLSHKTATSRNSKQVEPHSGDIVSCYYICNYSGLCKLVEIAWKRRQTSQLSEELPSTPPSRAKQTRPRLSRPLSGVWLLPMPHSCKQLLVPAKKSKTA